MRTTQLVRLLAGTFAFITGSIAIAQNQMGSIDPSRSGLSSQSALSSPYSTSPPFVTPMAPQYGSAQNASPFMNSPAISQTNPIYASPNAAPDLGPSIKAPMPGPSDSDIVSGMTMSSQAGSSMSTQAAPETSHRSPASVPQTSPMGSRPAIPPAH